MTKQTNLWGEVGMSKRKIRCRKYGGFLLGFGVALIIGSLIKPFPGKAHLIGWIFASACVVVGLVLLAVGEF